jgi:hypothetical protein
MPMNWALYRALGVAPRRSGQCALDLFALSDARDERVRRRLSYSKKFLRILLRNGLSRSPTMKKVRESLLSDSAKASVGSVLHGRSRSPRANLSAAIARASP